MRALVTRLGGGLVVGIGLTSGAFQVFDIPGGLWVGIASILVIAAVVVVAFSWRSWSTRRSGSPTHVSLDTFFRGALELDKEVLCVFSAGDDFRQLLEGGLFTRLSHVIRPNSTIRLVYRRRSGPDAYHVAENINRIASKLAEVGVRLDARGISWDYFVVGGVLVGVRTGAIKFYYRNHDRTSSVDQRYLLVNASMGGYDEVLVNVFKTEFEALWSQSTPSGPVADRN